MRKVLLTVMMVSSLLAFNACKKDGVQGPAGPAGATGATGATGPAGAVGAAGAAGANGTKILSGTVDPVTADGAVGDYFFNKTTKTLWGPKVAAGWAGTNTVLTGGSGGGNFYAGAGVPNATAPTNAVVGDYYFNVSTSTIHGPKLADGTWTSAIPIGASAGGAAITYDITRGFENVVGTKVYGSDLVNTYDGRNNFGSLDFKVTADDLIRIAQFPNRADGSGGYSEDREMVFETSAGSNIWTVVAKEAANFGKSTAELVPGSPMLAETYPSGIVSNGISGPNKIEVGARFRYSHNSVNPLATFTLTQNDIDRFKSSGGSAFGYFTHAKMDPTTVTALGQSPVFYDFKTTTVKKSTTRYYATYTAQTKLNLDVLVPNLEKYKQDGKVFLKYRYYNTNTTATSNNTVINHGNLQAGWAEITQYVNSYAKANGSTTAGSTAYSTVGISNVNPFSLMTGAGSTDFAPTTATLNHPGGTSYLGLAGNLVTLEPNQLATAATVTTGPVANRTTFLDGNVVINWNIQSGINAPLQDTYIGPTEFRNPNPGTDTNPIATAYTAGNVYEAFVWPGVATDSWITRGGFPINTSLTTRNFYSSATLPGATLFAKDEAGATIPWTAPNNDRILVDLHRGGKPESYFLNTKLVKVQVFVIPGDVVKTLKAKGVNVDNLNEVSKYVKL